MATPDIRYVAQYAPDIYEVILDGARIGSVQKFGDHDWVAQPAVGPSLGYHGRSITTRREAGQWVVAMWRRFAEES